MSNVHTSDTHPMAAVAGPSRRFCSHCYRAVWACKRRAPVTAVSKPISSVPRLRPSGLISRCGPVLLRRSFSSTISVQAAKKLSGKAPAIDMEQFPPERIRNFSIIAHIDHGKSTLADRLLQMTNTLPADSSPQFLDRLKVERERGITVKAQTVSIIHTHTDGEKYLINLIDTPGHVDFSYEVSRSLGACEGGLLLVDSTQGIQAQTLSVFYVALEADLTILGVINKIDLPHADAATVSETMETQLGIEKEGHMRISAKNGIGVDEVLRQIIEVLPPPRQRAVDDGKLRALVFDTHYDHFRGVVSLIRVMSGSVKVGDKIRFLQADRKYEVTDIGINNPDETPVGVLREGQVGYLVCSMKNSDEAHIGDTICHDTALVDPLPGFKPSKSMVFAGVFPTDSADFDKLEEAIGRLTLNDRSVTVAKESSAALMQGFRLGFLGTLHMDVFKQRLEDEYSSEVIITSPTVPYRLTKNGITKTISNPCDFPDHTHGYFVEEPMIHSTIIVPTDYLGPLMDLCSKYRSRQLEYRILETNRAILRYAFPLSEIVTDFFSALKSTSSGFASFDYEEAGYEESDLGKLSILLNGNAVDALSMIVHKTAAQSMGKEWCKKMKEVIPRQQFELAVQAAISGKIVARETVKAVRKDVTAGLYGGDYSRKKKQLVKQQVGKKRLKRLAGNIDVPQSAFFSVLSRSYATTAESRPGPTDIATLPVRRSSRQIDFRYAPSEEAGPIDSSLIVFPNWLPKYQLPRLNDEPLATPSITPLQRSIHLSRLFGLLDPVARPEPRRIHSAFSAVYHLSPSHILTPDEISAVLQKLLQAIKREGTAHEDAQDMVHDIRRALNSSTDEVGLPTYTTIASKIRSTKNPTATVLALVEKQILAWPKRHDTREYRDVVHLFLRLCAALPDPQRFERWWNRAELLGLDLYYHSSRLTLLESLGKVDEIEQPFLEGIKYIVDGKKQSHENRLAYINHALGIAARAGSWDFASGVYEALTGSHVFPSSSTGTFFGSSIDDQSTLPLALAHIRDMKIRPDRITYSTLLNALAQSGYLSEAVQVLQYMDRTNHTPFIADYSILFRGFTLYSEIVPPESAEQQATYSLFPDWEISETGTPVSNRESHAPAMWNGSYHSSDWTRSALDKLFASLLTLKPGMRRVESWTNENQRVDSYRAPSPIAIVNLLYAYARVSRCDVGLLNSVWEAVDRKFSAGEWTDWESLYRQRELDGIDPDTSMEEARSDEVVNAETDGRRRGDWVYWRANKRLARLVVGLQAVQRGEAGPEQSVKRERKRSSKKFEVKDSHGIQSTRNKARGAEEEQGVFPSDGESFFTSDQ